MYVLDVKYTDNTGKVFRYKIPETWLIGYQIGMGKSLLAGVQQWHKQTLLKTRKKGK